MVKSLAAKKDKKLRNFYELWTYVDENAGKLVIGNQVVIE